jgi:hypothetical protein
LRVITFDRDEGNDCLAGRRIRRADDGRLGDARIAHEGMFDFRCRDAVAGHVHHVIDASEQPQIPIGISLHAVAGEVAAGKA